MLSNLSNNLFKRSIGALLGIFIFITGYLNGYAITNEESLINKKNYLPHINIGEPFTSFTPVDSCFGVVDGKNMLFYSSTGQKVLFNAVNLDDKKVEFTYAIEGSKSAWSHAIAPNGKVYILADSQLLCYDPIAKQMSNLGKTLDQTACYALSFDEKDNIYMGTYPNGKILKYSVKDNKFEDLGQVVPEHKYVRSLVYKDGYLYAGTFGDRPRFVKINVNNISDKKEIEPLKKDGWYKPEELTWLYNMNLVGDYIFINAKIKSSAPLFVYDIKNEKFIDHNFLPNYRGIHTSPLIDNKTYFTSGTSLFAYDITSHKVVDQEINIGSIGLYGVGVVNMKNDPDLPGVSIATVDNTDGSPVFINLETKQVKKYTDIDLVGNPAQLQSIENGVSGKLILGAFMGTKSATYDVNSNEFFYFPSHQAESSLGYKDKMFLGLYTNANIQVLDSTKEINKDNPKIVKILGEEQDRPYRMTGANDKIYIGSYPKYGKLGGALSIMDYNTYETKVLRNIVPEQSIMSLAFKDDKLYLSTSIFGGLGTNPTNDKAKLVIFDTKTEKIIKESIPVIPGDVGDITALGDVSFGPDGLLWVAARNMVFAVDPETLAVKKNISLGVSSEKTFSKESPLFRPYFIRWDADGLLYTTAGANGIKVIDPNTLQVRKLDKEAGGVLPITLMTIGPDGNIYYQNYLEGAMLKMIPVSKYPYNPSEYSMLKEKLSDKMALYIGKTNVVNNGEIITTDCAPFTQNNRTFLPVRFIAEALNAEVEWIEETKTVVLTKEKDTIKIVLNDDKIIKNDKEIPIDSPAFTKEGRTFLPLRSLAETMGKEVFWDGEGLIVLSNKMWEEPNEITGKLAACMKFYNNSMDSATKKDLELKTQYEKEIANLGTPLKIVNNSFEEDFNGWEIESDVNNGNTTTISNEKAFFGSKSFKIIDLTSTTDATLISDYIPIDSNKKLTLSTMLYIGSGRTSLGIYYYDSNKQFLNREELHITDGQGKWQHIMLEAKRPMGAYARIKLFTSPYFVSDCYYDDVNLFAK